MPKFKLIQGLVDKGYTAKPKKKEESEDDEEMLEQAEAEAKKTAEERAEEEDEEEANYNKYKFTRQFRGKKPSTEYKPKTNMFGWKKDTSKP